MTDVTTFNALKTQLQKEGRAAFVIATDSMAPLIKPGDTIVVEPLVNGPRLFDIVVYWGGTQLICHYVCHTQRSLSSDDDLVVTRPLIQMRDDKPIEVDKILGQVVSHTLPTMLKLKLAYRMRFKRNGALAGTLFATGVVIAAIWILIQFARNR